MRFFLTTSMLAAALFVAVAPTTTHAIGYAPRMSGVQTDAVKHEVSSKRHRNRFSRKGCRLSGFGLRCGGGHRSGFDGRRNKQYGGSHGNSYSKKHGGGRY